MDSVSPYITIGSIILNIILVIVLLILYSQQFTHTIRSFVVWLYKWLMERPMAFNQWLWSGKYRPSCEIVKVGELEITEIHDHYYLKYQMQLVIDVKYTSNDYRFPTSMDCTTILLDVLNTGKDRDKTPYRLHRSAHFWRIEPPDEIEEGCFPEVPLQWDLPSNEYRIIRYTLRGEEMAEPLLDDSTFCKIIAIGEAQVERIRKIRQLKTGNKFPVKVVKKY